MQPFNNIDAANNYKLLNQAGSFWSTRVQPREQVLTLLNLASQTRLFGDLRRMVDGVTGQNHTPEKFVVLRFIPRDVFVTGTLVFDDAEARQYQYTANTDVVYNRRGLNYYGVPVTTHIPRCIRSSGNLLVLGSDYFVTSNYLMFRQDPRALFPNGIMNCPVADPVSANTTFNYLLRCRAENDQNFVTQYYRNRQSPDAFLRACAAIAGLAITHYPQRLIAMRQQGSEYIYTFQWETLRADYPHEALTVGQVYPAYTIIGDGIKFIRDDGTGTKNWWRQVDWTGGLDLTPFLRQFPTLSLKDEDTLLYSAGADVGSSLGSRVHARIKLTDDFFAEKPYWDWVAAQETYGRNYINGMPMASLPEDTGRTLAGLLAENDEANVINRQMGWPTEQPDLESLPNRKLVNAIDFYFASVWQKRGMIILIDHTQINDQANFYQFLAREMLIGIMPIVISHGLNLQETMDFGNSGNATFTDSVTPGTGGYIRFTETVVLSDIMTDNGVVVP